MTRVDPPANQLFSHYTTQRPPHGQSNESVSYDAWRSANRPMVMRPLGQPQQQPVDNQPENQVEQPNNNNNNNNQFEENFDYDLAAQIGNEHGSQINAALDALTNQAGGSSSISEPVAGTSTGGETMGTKRGNDGVQGTPAPPPQPTGEPAPTMQGRRGGSDGGFDSAQGPVSVLPTGGYNVSPGQMAFKKVHRMKSWAIPYYNVPATTPTRNGCNFVTTPLAKIPWEYAFFYLSKEEFDLLPAGSYIDSVAIKVTQTVVQTAFPTGATTATTATANHPKVLVIGHDLEKKCRGGVNRVVNLSPSMIPSFGNPADMQSYFADFIEKQYGSDQTASVLNVVVPGAAHKIPFYNRAHFIIYQPDAAEAAARGFTAANAPGFEYFQNYVTEMNANDTTWSVVDQQSYKFENAPIGNQYEALEILTDTFSQKTGNARYYNAERSVVNTGPGQATIVTESFGPSTRNSVPIVTYQSAPMEKGCYFVRGDSAGKPSRQPSYHIGMRSIDKSAPDNNKSRAGEFVQAVIEFEIEASMVVNLPSYPNRFTRPKYYNVGIENAVMGIGSYPAHQEDQTFVTFGLLNDTDVAPAVAAVDATEEDQNTEGNLMTRGRSRPKRSFPRVPIHIKRKPVTRSDTANSPSNINVTTEDN